MLRNTKPHFSCRFDPGEHTSPGSLVRDPISHQGPDRWTHRNPRCEIAVFSAAAAGPGRPRAGLELVEHRDPLHHRLPSPVPVPALRGPPCELLLTACSCRLPVQNLPCKTCPATPASLQATKPGTTQDDNTRQQPAHASAIDEDDEDVDDETGLRFLVGQQWPQRAEKPDAGSERPTTSNSP